MAGIQNLNDRCDHFILVLFGNVYILAEVEADWLAPLNR